MCIELSSEHFHVMIIFASVLSIYEYANVFIGRAAQLIENLASAIS